MDFVITKIENDVVWCEAEDLSQTMDLPQLHKFDDKRFLILESSTIQLIHDEIEGDFILVMDETQNKVLSLKIAEQSAGFEIVNTIIFDIKRFQ